MASELKLRTMRSFSILPILYQCRLLHNAELHVDWSKRFTLV